MPDDAGSWVELLPSELAMLRHPVIATVTFFDGEAPTDFLQQKTEALLDANPWLTGRLKSGAPSGSPGVWVPGAPDKGVHFRVLSNEALRPGLSMDETVAALGGEMVQRGALCLDRDEPLFKVAVVRATPGQFAVVLSMSHVFADGSTYYALWAALGGGAGAPAPKLNPVRKPAFEAAMREALGPAQYAWQHSGGVKAMFVGTLLGNALWGKPLAVRAWYANAEFIAAQKSQAPGDVPFVSTNDILTSWFFRRNKCDYGLMAVNFRGRLLDLTAADAGNYEGCITYWPHEFATPGGVRRALLRGPAFNTGRAEAPSFLRTARARIGMATSWAGFAAGLELPGCRQTLHLPILQTAGVFEAFVIFRPTPDTVGFLIADRFGDLPLDDAAMGPRIF